MPRNSSSSHTPGSTATTNTSSIRLPDRKPEAAAVLAPSASSSSIHSVVTKLAARKPAPAAATQTSARPGETGLSRNEPLTPGWVSR